MDLPGPEFCDEVSEKKKRRRCKEEEEKMLQQAEERETRILRCCDSVQLGPG